MPTCFSLSKTREQWKSSKPINKIQNCRMQRLESRWLSSPILPDPCQHQIPWFVNEWRSLKPNGTSKSMLIHGYKMHLFKISRKSILFFFLWQGLGKPRRRGNSLMIAQEAMIFLFLTLVFAECHGLWGWGHLCRQKGDFVAHSTLQTFPTSSLLRKHLY